MTPLDCTLLGLGVGALLTIAASLIANVIDEIRWRTAPCTC